MSVLQEISGTSSRRLMSNVMGGGSSKGKLEQCKLAVEKTHAYAAAQSVGSKLSERIVRLAPTQPAEESSNSETTCTANGHNSRPNQKQDPQNWLAQVWSSIEIIETKYSSQEVTSIDTWRSAMKSDWMLLTDDEKCAPPAATLKTVASLLAAGRKSGTDKARIISGIDSIRADLPTNPPKKRKRLVVTCSIDSMLPLPL
ncbi:hypothetical protein SeMB42_g08016, partial [Synchytrium endobioticum]